MFNLQRVEQRLGGECLQPPLGSLRNQQREKCSLAPHHCKKIKQICKELGASLVLSDENHIQVEFKKGVTTS
jgi:hypothetical protein